jgi:hypothetical protein
MDDPAFRERIRKMSDEHLETPRARPPRTWRAHRPSAFATSVPFRRDSSFPAFKSDPSCLTHLQGVRSQDELALGKLTSDHSPTAVTELVSRTGTNRHQWLHHSLPSFFHCAAALSGFSLLHVLGPMPYGHHQPRAGRAGRWLRSAELDDRLAGFLDQACQSKGSVPPNHCPLHSVPALVPDARDPHPALRPRAIATGQQAHHRLGKAAFERAHRVSCAWAVAWLQTEWTIMRRKTA